MAARKSCTHLTWAEAKNKNGISDGKGQRKNKEVLRKQDHGAVLAAKIIKKQGGDVASADNRKLQKAYRKQEEKLAAIAAKREEERELKRLASLQEVRPYDMARERLEEILQELRATDADVIPKLDNENPILHDEETQEKIAECKRMQLDEVMALEAMIPEYDFVVSRASKIAELEGKLEQMQYDSVASHTPLSYFIKLDIDNNQETSGDGYSDMNLNVLVLLRVTLPPLYLNSEGSSQVPQWSFEYVMVTDKDALCSADKPLESLAWLEEDKLKQAISKEAQENLLPYPCVFEMTQWLVENIFEYLKMHSHVLATK